MILHPAALGANSLSVKWLNVSCVGCCEASAAVSVLIFGLKRTLGSGFSSWFVLKIRYRQENRDHSDRHEPLFKLK